MLRVSKILFLAVCNLTLSGAAFADSVQQCRDDARSDFERALDLCDHINSPECRNNSDCRGNDVCIAGSCQQSSNCNSYGCYPAGGGCSAYGCWGPGGGCNAYGCWDTGGGCNSYGCWAEGGGCNANGCWGPNDPHRH